MSEQGPQDTQVPVDHSRVEPVDFGSPFDDSDADLILRSSDLVDFLVYRIILAKASPVFRTMLSIPQPALSSSSTISNAHLTLTQHKPPVVQLSEDSQVLRFLLSSILPIREIFPESVEDGLSVAAAAQKYDCECAIQRANALLSERITTDNCIRAYGTSHRLRLREPMVLSARLSLDRSIAIYDLGDDLRYLTGTALLDLAAYRKACADHLVLGEWLSSLPEQDNEHRWKLLSELQLPVCSHYVCDLCLYIYVYDFLPMMVKEFAKTKAASSELFDPARAFPFEKLTIEWLHKHNKAVVQCCGVCHEQFEKASTQARLCSTFTGYLRQAVKEVRSSAVLVFFLPTFVIYLLLQMPLSGLFAEF